MKKIAHLFTPGLDSYLGDWYLNNRDKLEDTPEYLKGKTEVIRTYFNLKSKYSKLEGDFLREIY